MITTGHHGWYPSRATKTEIVDVASGENCAVLADFPLKINGAVGANLHGTPVVCGGYSFKKMRSSRECYKFKNGTWTKFATMKDKRHLAAGVMFKNKLHIFGGYHYNNDSIQQTSEIITINGKVEYGPDLPTGVGFHTITAINATVSILAGGETYSNDSSPLTWYFNHETEAFSPGPSLLRGRSEHGSATISDKKTKVKIPVVTGGYDYYSNDVLSSTELLINGQWQSGTIRCKKNLFSLVTLCGTKI